MRSLKFIAATIFALALAGAAFAQGRRTPANSGVSSSRGGESMEAGSIRGRVLTPEGSPISGTARITLQATNGGQFSIFTDYMGQFNFPSLDPGYYTLEVDGDPQLFVPSSQGVQVYKGMPSVVALSLKYKPGASRPAPGDAVVSVAELDKTIPEKARKEFKRGAQAAQLGKTEEAIGHYRKALDIYPDFMMARNDLGTQLLATGHLDEAAEQLRLAVKLDAKAFNPQLNLGIVLARQQQFAEAALALEKAIALSPQSAAPRLYAGQAYAALGDAARAEKELKAAFDLGGPDYAVALFHLGHLYLNRGERELARKSFEAYLGAAPGAADAAQVRKLIGVLR